jgi:predicted GTPase
LLDLAREHGYETITITFHGTLDERLKLAPQATYPLKGVLRGVDFEEVVKRIQTYSPSTVAEKSERSFSGFRINAGVTVGQHNRNRAMLI